MTACRETAAELAICWRRSGKSWFDFLHLSVAYLFARFWHGCACATRNSFPATGPALLIANHASHADPGFLVGMTHRSMHFVQARECYEVPLLRGFFARTGCIPVSREKADPGALRQMLHCLQAGEVVAIFPEGEVNPRWGGPLQPGKPGVALLALRSRAPVIPAWIEGGPRPRTSPAAWLSPSSRVDLYFGQPIDLSRYYGGQITRPRLNEVTGVLMQHLAALRPGRQPAQLQAAIEPDVLTLPP